jgi:hypothetical protein
MHDDLHVYLQNTLEMHVVAAAAATAVTAPCGLTIVAGVAVCYWWWW